ncbi:DUF3500 domain-containing protein [uncultured Paludibaculum sp.]|uniref:DUF3500 domain-containing protein n=1 Tax=uncultured Paludibaculum sp. TaxID=1765020 RepID=UPI002AABAFE9|nr:DUF3500 domain-containing protein [uncultured Paludibaculum sp.]
MNTPHPPSKKHAPHHHHPPRLSRRMLFSTLIPGAILAPHAFPQNSSDMAETFRRRSAEAESKGLADPFRGITANGTIEPGLYDLHSTGVSTAPVRTAAERFLASLTNEQRGRTMFAVDDPEWRKWMNQHFYVRQGVSFQEMSGTQRDAAFGVLETALSARGLKLTRDIMRLNETLAELSNDHEFLGEWRYHITVMGKPSATEPWGFQLDGHHIIINYFVLGDQVVMTPFFAGSEPVTATSGKYKGISILQDEQSRGLEMLRHLDKAQQAKAVLNPEKTKNYNLTEAFRDNIVLDYAGARAASFTQPQRKQLLDLVDLYVGNMDEGHAKVRMDEVKKRIERTSFAWIGGSDDSSVYYYRIHSPVILIEFDHQQPANLRKFAKDPSMPTRQHIHCVVRTPNGNDYGKDLLRQHYLSHAHA